MNIPVMVSLVESGTCAIPKSITTGSPRASITLPGLRSRCTTPAACTAARAKASPAHDLLERLAADVPGDDVGRLAGHVRVEDLGHERAAHPPHGLHLAGEPAARVRVVRH